MNVNRPEKDKVVYVRVPPDIHDALSAWAVEDRRSITALTLIILEKAIKARESRRKTGEHEEIDEGNRNAELMPQAA